MTIKELSKITGISQETLRMGARAEKFDFIVAVPGKGRRFIYVVLPEKVKECFGYEVQN